MKRLTVMFRNLAKSDALDVVQLLQDVSKYEPTLSDVTTSIQCLIQNTSAHARVMLVDGSVVGFGTVFLYRRVRGAHVGVLEDIVVARRYRRNGLGRLLIEELLTEARKAGCHKVTLETASASKDFYSSLGFECGGPIMKIFL